MKKEKKIILLLILFIGIKVNAASNTILINEIRYYTNNNFETESYSYDKESNTLTLNNYNGSRIETDLDNLNIHITGYNILKGSINLIQGNNLNIIGDGTIEAHLIQRQVCRGDRELGCDACTNLFYANNITVDNLIINSNNETKGYSLFYVINDIKITNSNIDTNDNYIIAKANNIYFENNTIIFNGYIMFDYLPYGDFYIKDSYIEGKGNRFISSGGPLKIENSYIDIYAEEIFTFSNYIPETVDNSRIYVSKDNQEFELIKDLDQYVLSHYLVILEPGYVLINGMVEKEQEELVEDEIIDSLDKDIGISTNNEIIEEKKEIEENLVDSKNIINKEIETNKEEIKEEENINEKENVPIEISTKNNKDYKVEKSVISKKNSTINPKTGDKIFFIIPILIISLASIIGLLIYG